MCVCTSMCLLPALQEVCMYVCVFVCGGGGVETVRVTDVTKGRADRLTDRQTIFCVIQ